MTIKVVKEPITDKQARAAAEEASQKLMSGIERFVGDAPTTGADGNGGAGAAKAAQGWVGASYDKASGRAAEFASAVGATATTVGDGARQYVSQLVGQVGDLAKSALQALDSDVFTKLPPEPQASVGEVKAAIKLADQQAAAAQKQLANPANGADPFATIQTELGNGVDESMKALAKCQADVQQAARSGDKASNAAQISLSNLLHQWTQAKVNLVRNWRD